MNYVDVAQARTMPGLRLVLSPGGPGPWSEAAKSICHVKRLAFVPVAQDVGGPNPDLQQWTAQTSAPVAAWNDERPRSTWIEQMYLFERLAPAPRLIPDRLEDRVLMFGYANEICGETGLGWSRRMMMFARRAKKAEAAGKGPGLIDSMAVKYGYQPEVGQAAPARVAEIIGALAQRLDHQRASGSRFFIGNQLSALDIYWAAFSGMCAPLPAEICPMSPGLRKMYGEIGPLVEAALSPLLLEHRDFIYGEFLQVPLDF